jgi:hypothetical protein
MKTQTCLRLALAAVLMATASAQSERFTLAIVRLDGRLVPFAAYDRSRWERAWPEDESYLIAEIGPSEVRYPIDVNGGGC